MSARSTLRLTAATTPVGLAPVASGLIRAVLFVVSGFRRTVKGHRCA